MPSPYNAQFDSAKLLLRFEVEIPGKIDAISPVVDRVMELLGSIGCGQGNEFAIETALPWRMPCFMVANKIPASRFNVQSIATKRVRS